MGLFSWKGQKLWPTLSACLLRSTPLFTKSGKGPGWLKRQDRLVSPGRWMGTRLLLWVSLQVAEVSRCKRWKGVRSISRLVCGKGNLLLTLFLRCPVAHSHTINSHKVWVCLSQGFRLCSQPRYTLHSCLLPQTVKWAVTVSLMRPLILRRDTEHTLPSWSREDLHKQFPKSLAFHSLLSIIRFVSFFSLFF